MNGEIRLKIAGIGISVRWNGSQVVDWPRPGYRDFICNDRADAEINVHCDTLPEYPRDKLIFDGEENWRFYQNKSGYVMELFDTLTHEKCAVGFMKPDFSSSDIYISPQWALVRHSSGKGLNPPCWSFPFLMQPFGQLLLINLLAGNRGIMVHGLGINDRGKGMVFVGRSGAGKSTMAEFYKDEKGAIVLNDERIIIKKKDGRFRVYGTPWPGMAMTVSSQGIPVDKLFFIHHAPENTVSSQDTVSSLNCLFPQMFLSFWDRNALDCALKLSEELISGVECRRLGFIKDRSVIDFVRAV